jgi:hypothetical protein
MKVLLSCLLLAFAVGIENAPVKEASSCNGADVEAEKAMRALASPTAPAGTPAQYQLPKYDRRQLDRLFETSTVDNPSR